MNERDHIVINLATDGKSVPSNWLCWCGRRLEYAEALYCGRYMQCPASKQGLSAPQEEKSS